MTNFMISCIDRYKELCSGVRLKEAHTPFLPEDSKDSPHGKPLVEGTKVSECPHCYA